jgi:hypothetical protein
MARPTIGTIIEIRSDKGGLKYIQSRPDTWANTDLAAELDHFRDKQDDELVRWFDKGADVIRERVTRG